MSIQVSSMQNHENSQTMSLPLFSTLGSEIPVCQTQQQRETALSEFKTMIASKLNLATQTECGGDLWTRIAYLNMSSVILCSLVHKTGQIAILQMN